MIDVKEQLRLYRKRVVNISNKKIEIENLKIKGISKYDISIRKLEQEINTMENENRKVDNILSLLEETEYKIINWIYIEGKNKRRVAKELDRTERQINYILEKGISNIRENWIV